MLATGGTLDAAISLIADAGGELTSIIVLIEISALKGRERLTKVLPNVPLHALVTI